MPSPRLLAMVVALVAAAAAAEAPAPLPVRPGAGAPPVVAGWRAARWGMTVEETLEALPGEAKRLQKPVELADGNVVAAGIDAFALEGLSFQVRFVYQAGRLAMVSLRTPERTYAAPEAFTALEKHLSETLGKPDSTGRDDNFIDLRQARWRLGPTHVDLKFIPGVVVLQYYPAPAGRP